MRWAHDRLIDAWSSRAMITILTGQRHNGLLPQPLPPGTQIAHKTGTLHDTLNDVGIVYLNSSPYIIAVLTTQLPSLAAGRRFIRGVSRVAYDAFERFADWRETNGYPGLPIAPQAPALPDISPPGSEPTDAVPPPQDAPLLPAAAPLPLPQDAPPDAGASPVPATPTSLN